MRLRYIAPAVALALVCLHAPAPARADDVAAASKAFAQAQKAGLAGNHARAAELYELADSLARAEPALRLAVKSHYSAGHLATAATLATELLRRYPSEKEARATAEKILAELTPQLAQIDVDCDGGCSLAVDGRALSEDILEHYTFFTQPGERELVAVFDEGEQTQKVEAVINQTTTVKIEPPDEAEPVEPDKPGNGAVSGAVTGGGDGDTTTPADEGGEGISRLWFVGGAVLTVAVGAAATLSGLQTLDTRDKIVDAAFNGEDTHDLYETGRDQQIRTNILFGATAVAGVATIALAFVTNWSGDSDESQESAPAITFVPSADGAAVVYGARF